MIWPTKNNHVALLAKPNHAVVLASSYRVVLLAKHNHVALLAKPNCLGKADGKQGKTEQFCSNT